MEEYLAMRIKKGKLNYYKVIATYPSYQQELNRILSAGGYQVNPDGTVIKL